MIGFVITFKRRMGLHDEWTPHTRAELALVHPGIFPYSRAYYVLLDAATRAGIRMGPP